MIKNFKWIFVVVFALTLISPAFAWWNSSWNYRQAINISNTAGNLTNYQVKIELNSSNVGSNFNWSNNGSDIRFTNSTDDLLYYWIEYWNSSSQEAVIWVNVTYLENNTNTTVYLYYGNSEASSESNGSTVFEFFDDFEDGTLGSQWEYHDGCSADDYYEESSGVGTIHVNYVSGCSSRLHEANYNDTPTLEGSLPDTDFELIVVYYNWNPPAGDPPYHNIGVDFVQDSDDFVGHMLTHSDWQDKYSRNRYKVDTGISSTTETARYTPDTQTYRYVKVIRTGDTYHFYYSTDGESWDDEGSETKSGLTKFALSVYVGSGSYSGSFDFVQIRKYASPEPSVSNFGSEEIAPVSFSITLNSPANGTTICDPTPDFNFTVSGTESSYSCELFINDTGYGTITANNNTPTIITANQSLSYGTYIWYINCSVGAITNQSEIWEITIHYFHLITPLSINLLTDRESISSRKIEESVSPVFTFSKFRTLTKSILEEFFVYPSTARIKSSIKSITDFIGITEFADKIAIYTREPDVEVYFEPTILRNLEANRELKLTAQITPEMMRKLEANRELTIAYTIDMEFLKETNLNRLTVLHLTLIPQLARNIEVGRDNELSLTITPQLFRELVKTKNILTAITITPEVFREINLAKINYLTITITPELARELNLTKSATITIVLTPELIRYLQT
ncbi:MAG: hypothetical protein DRI61_15420, partial [Chloroflexi bacterium]